MYKNTRKEDLLQIAFELGITVLENATLITLKGLIESSEVFKANVDFVKYLVASTVEERKAREDNESAKIELEKIKLAQLERQIELANLRNTPSANLNSSRNSDASEDGLDIEKACRTLSMPMPTRPENYSLFFQSLERSFTTKRVQDEIKSEIFINISGEKASHVLLNISENDLREYEKVKNAVLKHFQPTPHECLMNFRKSQRMPDESHTQFASRLTTSLEYYCKIRKATDFKTLSQLIIADKLYSTLDYETQSHITIIQGEEWLKPPELAQKCDVFFTSKRKSLS
nr:uncharacterized protein LOC122273874 [Parasteatoda tepidariorum]